MPSPSCCHTYIYVYKGIYICIYRRTNTQTKSIHHRSLPVSIQMWLDPSENRIRRVFVDDVSDSGRRLELSPDDWSIQRRRSGKRVACPGRTGRVPIGSQVTWAYLRSGCFVGGWEFRIDGWLRLDVLRTESRMSARNTKWLAKLMGIRQYVFRIWCTALLTRFNLNLKHSLG